MERVSAARSMAALMLMTAIPKAALAQELVYQPISPAFGGNPLNGNYLLNAATLQDTYKDPDDLLLGLDGEPDPNAQFEEFGRQLTARVISRLASDAATAIFGDLNDPNNLPGAFREGVIDFGDQTIGFVRDPINGITLTLTTSTGGTTTIRIPVIRPRR